MKKRIHTVVMLGMVIGTMLLAATGCGKTKNSDNTEDTGTDASIGTDTETVTGLSEAPENGAQPELWTPADYVSDELMAEADMWQSCDDTALAAVMRKAEAGEAVTICCIGGSITQGTISDGTSDSLIENKKCYADLFFSWWEHTFPDTEFKLINAGIGATDSYLGVHRVQKDVLDDHPDLVLVEFSVNDSDGIFYKKSYDNLVRKIAQSDSAPAVMLLFMGQTNGVSAQQSHVLVGFNYKLPMISYGNVINAMLENGIYTEKELSADTLHPSALGHTIAGEILSKYLNAVYLQRNDYAEPAPFDFEPLTKQSYADAGLLDSTDISVDSPGSFREEKSFDAFPNGWLCSEGEGELTVTLKCRNLGILYCKETDQTGGQFDVYIDGERVQTLDADFTGGWGRYADAKEVFVSEEETEHTIMIRKAEGSTGDVIAILGFLVS